MSAEMLVLVPGLNCTGRLFADQIEALGRGRPVLVADNASDDSMGAMAQRLLAAAPERFALAGLSMGGFVAFEVLRRAPERVTRVALLDTTARPDSPDRAAMRAEQVARARAGRFEEVIEEGFHAAVHPARHEDEALRRVRRDMGLATGVEGFARQIAAMSARADSRPDLARIGVPTLVLCGEEDELTPLRLSREIAEGIAGARLEVVPHCGHLSTLEKPATVTKLLADWLAA
jgi:pimeloyl-ACP methyl ester carboxylesterase